MSENNYQLDYLVEVLKECNFDDDSILGFSFYFSRRISFIVPGDKTNDEQDSQEFITNRFNSYFDVDLCEQFINQYPQEIIDTTFIDISKCFKSFAYYLRKELSEDRLNVNGDKTQAFNPEKVIELSPKEPHKILTAFDWNELYSKFFNELGKALSQCTSGYKEAFAFSELFSNMASRIDQIGYLEIIQHSFLMPPPFYDLFLDPNKHDLFFDENGPREDKLLPFQIPLRIILPNQIVGEFVWDQIRFLFFQKNSTEPVNTHLQFQDISNSEPLLEEYYEKIFIPNISHFLARKEEILQALEGVNSPDFLKLNTIIIVSSKVKIQSKFDLIYTVLRDNWGFDVNNRGSHISSNLTFLAYFYYSFMVCCIINLDDSD